MRKSIHALSQTELIDALKMNNSYILKQFYTLHYKKVEALVLKNSGSTEQAKDVYQDAFITVWTHVKNDKFVPKNDTALQGYLYSIAKNKWTDILRSKAYKNSNVLNETTLTEIKDNKESTTNEQELKLKAAMAAFKNLDQPCKQLLSDFYFEKKSLKDIAQSFKIEENTARNKKYRCMQKLRNMVIAPKKERIGR
ncbi:hypothetical protein PW52_08855 [Tamlana sedimentorum]|uniref:RNA polymerase sigma-70 region 2 domain-containing protein n=1 Tax=Neotamlana sedimentorum TaxID=1435349 RepID=A0A0D7W9Q6_9FLAO|nr:sigma-70 family RNA polymerase sigma factor [Tamlana sedimentorum]KJD35829.1 hypothetical protein PW52_08855 [Tamlana sedimentorum]